MIIIGFKRRASVVCEKVGFQQNNSSSWLLWIEPSHFEYSKTIALNRIQEAIQYIYRTFSKDKSPTNRFECGMELNVWIVGENACSTSYETYQLYVALQYRQVRLAQGCTNITHMTIRHSETAHCYVWPELMMIAVSPTSLPVYIYTYM